MTENKQPYEPPRSRVADMVERAPRPWLGLALGALADIGGTMVAGVAVSVWYSTRLISEGKTPDQVVESLANMPVDSGIGMAATGAGLLCSLWGGYVCASFASVAPFKWGGILAAIVCLVGLAMGGAQFPPGLEFALLAATFVAVLAGVWLRERKRQIKRAA